MSAPAKDPAKDKCYFGCVPKEEVPKFLAGLKTALAAGSKGGEKKEVEIEIRGTKEEPKGISIETFSVDKSSYANYFDSSKDYMAKALVAFSVCITAKDEAGVEKFKALFDQFLPMIQEMPHIKEKKDKYLFNFRSAGKKAYIDVVSVEGKIVQPLLDLGVDISEYHNFKVSFKSDLDLNQLFADNVDIAQLSAKALSLVLSIKGSSQNIKYLTTAFGTALKDVKLNNEKYQKKFDKVVSYLSMINAFIGAKFQLEFDGKELAGTGSSASQEHLGAVNQTLAGYQTMVKTMGPQMIKPPLEQFGLVEPVKSADFDEISLCLAVPKYQNGIAHVIKLPGLSKILADILK